ncbi:MAG: 2-hydroxyacyl-CoA dehydratase family protein [Candidatus Omnitrophica bacterium]|nr:2-hydroxyacyl-CoA dehydratase family protein [Candidatus Omnitrophota bacterium]
MEKIGFVTTIPIEIVYASGNIPVDLNNLFINEKDPNRLVSKAEEEGFPRNFCTWIKGTYQIAKQLKIRKIITVREGECTNSEKQAEMFHYNNISCITFSYPHTRNTVQLKNEFERLMREFHVSWDAVEKIKNRLSSIRKKLCDLDERTYTKHTITGFENYAWLISSTDFNGDPDAYEERLDIFLSEVKTRDVDIYTSHKKIGLIGIPPIVNNIFSEIEKLNGIVVYNEFPRQFSMPSSSDDIIEQYRNFTYPYDITYRIEDIHNEIKKRKLDGIIHYVQSFCPRQVDDMILRKKITIPYLTIECDKPGTLDERNVTRLEAFFERWY